MKTRPYQVPEIPYKWLPVAWKTLRFGRLATDYDFQVSVHPRVQARADDLLACGQNLLDGSANDGNTANRQIPFDRSCCFIGAGILVQGQEHPENPATWIPIRNFGVTEGHRNGVWIATYRPYKRYTCSPSEDYTGNGSIYSGDNPEGYYTWHTEVAKQVKLQNNADWFDDYAGGMFVYIDNATQIANVRAAMRDTTGTTSLAKSQQGQPLNHRNTPGWRAGTTEKPQFYTMVRAVVQIYWIYSPATLDPFNELVKACCNFILVNWNLKALGNTTCRKMAFGWDSSTQVAGDKYAVQRRRTTPNGGTVTTDRFPTYPFAYAFNLRIYVMTHNFTDNYAWEDNYWYDEDENRIPQNSGSPGNLLTQYDGPSTAQFQTQVINYNFVDRSTFPPAQYSNDDALSIASDCGLRMFDYGGRDFAPAQIRERGTTDYSEAAWDAVLTAYEKFKAGGTGFYCQKASKVAGRYVLTILNLGKTAKHVEVPLAEGLWSSFDQLDAPIAPGVVYCLFVDAN